MDATPSCGRHDDLVAYLYDECDSGERERFEAHLASCGPCAAEIDALRSVRRSLGTWAPPEAALGFRIVSDPPRGAVRWWRRAGLRPAWGLAAAAAFVAAAIALGGLDFRWQENGLVVWMGRPGAGAAPAASAAPGTLATPVAVGGPPTVRVPAAGGLPVGVRAAGRSPAVGAPAAGGPGAVRAFAAGGPGTASGPRTAGNLGMGGPAPGHDELMRRIQALIEQSERRQEQEFAARLLALAQEFDLQRREDRIRVQQEVGDLAEYLVRVSGR